MQIQVRHYFTLRVAELLGNRVTTDIPNGIGIQHRFRWKCAICHTAQNVLPLQIQLPSITFLSIRSEEEEKGEGERESDTDERERERERENSQEYLHDKESGVVGGPRSH
jgi:hypothetical protein